MELRQLKTFITVASTLNFTKAADKLGYAQSSVTAQIKGLEEDLNVRLFERLGKNVYLTAAGEIFFGYANRILRLSKEARDALANDGVLKGTIAIGSVESLCSSRFPQIYRLFHERYPLVEVTVKIANTNELKVWLKENSIDVGFFLDILDAPEPDVINEFSMPEPMRIFAAKDHPLTKKKAVTAMDLKDEALILTESGCSYRMIFELMLKESGITPRSMLESGSIKSIKQLTTCGMGITFLPMVSVEEELANGELAPLNWAGSQLQVETQLIYHKDKWVTPIMRAFLDTAKEVLDETRVVV